MFDYAELCWRYNGSGKNLAEELGWSPETITRYKNIKDKLHPKIWKLTRNRGLVNLDNETLVNQELTLVNFTERHFRALLKHLPYTNRATYRALPWPGLSTV